MAKGAKQIKTMRAQQSAQESALPIKGAPGGGIAEIGFTAPSAGESAPVGNLAGVVDITPPGMVPPTEVEVAPLGGGEFAWRHHSTSEMLTTGEKIVYLGGDLNKLSRREDWGLVMDEEDMPIEIAAQLSYYGLSAEEARMYWRGDPEDFYNRLGDISSQAVYPEDFDRASQMLMSALANGEVIGIHYDYDADGICAEIVLEEHLRSVWPQPNTDIDDKIVFSCSDAQRGFGFFKDDVETLVEQGATLAFVLDSGPPEPAVVSYAQERGLKLVYVDHHELGTENEALRATVPILKLQDSNAATSGTAAVFSAYHKRHPLGSGGDDVASMADDLTVQGAARQFLQDQLGAHYTFYRLAEGTNAGSIVALPKDDSMEGYYLTLGQEAVAMPASTAAGFLQTQQDGEYTPCPVNRVSDELLVELGTYSPVRSDFYKEPLEIQDAALRQFLRLTPTQAQAAIVGNLGDAGSMMSLHNRLLYMEARTSMVKPPEEQTPFMHALREIINTRNNNKGFSGQNDVPLPEDVVFMLAPSMSIAKRTPEVSAAEVKDAVYGWTPRANAGRFVEIYLDLKDTADAHVAQFTDPNQPSKLLPANPVGLILVPGISERRYMGMGGRLAAQLTKETPNPLGVYIEDKATGSVRVNFRSGRTKLNVAALIEYTKKQLPDVPISGGGHSAAGGLSVPKQYWKQVYPVLQAGTAAQADATPYFYPTGGPAAQTEAKPIFVICPSTLSRISSGELREAIKRLQPFDAGGYGKGNREPLYLVDGGEMTISGKAGRSNKGVAVKDGVEMEFLTTEAAENFPYTGRAVFAWDNKYNIFRLRKLVGE